MKKSSLGAGFLIGTVFGVLAGSIGGSVDPAPETRFITVTRTAKPYVHYETETKYVVTPLPASCAAIVKDVKEITREINVWNNRAHDYYVQLEDVDWAAVTDQQANNRLVIRTNEILSNEEDALWAILERKHSIADGVSVCENDVEAAENGD